MSKSSEQVEAAHIRIVPCTKCGYKFPTHFAEGDPLTKKTACPACKQPITIGAESPSERRRRMAIGSKTSKRRQARKGRL